MKHLLPLALMLLVVASACTDSVAQPASKTPETSSMPSSRVRIVCVGDSITDGNTYPQIIMQAYAEAGKPVPAAVCAGVASDTAPMMAARLDPVLEMQPDIITFSAGTNDALKAPDPAVYEKAVREVAARCKAKNIKMVLLTPCAINEGNTNKPNATAEAVTAKYAQILRTVAKENGWPVAEVSKLQQEARAAGKTIMSADGIHPDYYGQALMARAVLDALGDKDVALPKEFRPQLLPGVIKTWKVQPAPQEGGKPKLLTTEQVAALKLDDTWKTYTLPEKQEPIKEGKLADATDWLEQERRNGFAISVERNVGKGPRYWLAELDEPSERKAFVNTGINTKRVWLNGKLIFEQPRDDKGNEKWTGFHAGKERLPVTLTKGKNTLVVEHDGPQFFVSVTDKLVWELDYAAAMEKVGK